LKMLLQGRKKRIKRSGEREIVCTNSWKLHLRCVSQSLFQKCRIESLKQHVLAEELYVGYYWKKGENLETGVTMAFSTQRKLRPKVCTKNILDNFDKAVLRRIVHNFYLTEKQRPTLKAIHSKMCESTGYGGVVSSLRLVLRKMGFR